MRRGGEMRHAEPTRHGPSIAGSAAYLDVSALDCVWKIDAPEADASECCDHTHDLEVHVVAGIVRTQIDVGTCQDEPVGSILVLPKTEENDDTLIGEVADTYQFSERPHQKIGVETIVLEVLARPVISPRSERFDDGTEGAPRGGQTIDVPPFAVAAKLFDNPAAAQRLETLGEQVLRNPRHAAVDVVEAKLAVQQLAQDEWRPALGEDLCAHGDGTELPIEAHGGSNLRSLAGRSWCCYVGRRCGASCGGVVPQRFHADSLALPQYFFQSSVDSSEQSLRMIEFRVLGAIELRIEGGREIAAVLRQPKRLGLLIYLAVTPGFCRRDKLVGLLWPEFEQSRARQALNKAVHHLRQSLGDSAIASRGDQELALEPSVVRCDVRQFEAALASGDTATAVNLYRGALADGLFVSEAAEFERWLSVERERIRTEAARAAGTLADGNARTDPSRAVAWSRRAVELSPFDETAVRRLMSLLARSGEVAGAAVAYDDLVRRLSTDLNVAPSVETRVLRESFGNPGGQSSPATLAVPVESLSPPAAEVPMSVSTPAPSVAGSATSPRRDRRLIAFAVAAACLVLALGGIAMARGAGARLTNRPLDATRLFVSVLENRTGDSTLNPIGVMATDWMIQGLSASDSIHVVDSRTAMLLTGTGGRTIAQLAEASGARFVIAGAYYKEGDSLRFMARLSDATTDRQQWTFTPVVAPINRPEAALASLQDQAQTFVAQAGSPIQIGDMLRTRSTPPRYDAYREYVLGIHYLLRRELQSAEQHFLMAARLDTTFTEALLNAATIRAEGVTPPTDSILRVLGRRRERLSSTSRLWLDADEAARRRDPSMLRDLGELARRYPESFFPARYGLALLSFRHLREADSVIRSLDPNGGWLRTAGAGHWPTLVMLDDMLDGVNAARADVAAGARAYPHNMAIASADARYLPRAGTLRQLDSLFDEALLLPKFRGYDAGHVMAVASLEAAAHGHRDWVPHIRDRALRWYGSLPAAERGAEDASGDDLCWMLASVRAWPELRSRVAALLASGGDSSRWLRYEALAAAHDGDTATLTRLDRRLSVAIDHASVVALAELLAERARVATLRGNSAEAVDLLGQAFAHNKAFDGLIHTDPSFETIWSDPRFARLLVPVDGGRR